jgi:hypothetical protein
VGKFLAKSLLLLVLAMASGLALGRSLNSDWAMTSVGVKLAELVNEDFRD